MLNKLITVFCTGAIWSSQGDWVGTSCKWLYSTCTYTGWHSHCVGYITMVTCTLLHEYTTLVEMVFIKSSSCGDKLGKLYTNEKLMSLVHKQWHFITSCYHFYTSSSRCLPEVVLYNEPTIQYPCKGYWPNNENVRAMPFIRSGVMRCDILSLPDYIHMHIVLI